MTHNQIDYPQILRSRGYRVTPQRVTILDAICEGEGHSTLGEIYARAHKQDPAIDKSTVYRALELFEKVGLVLSAEFDRHERGYEIIKPERHHHLICEKCWTEFDIEHRAVEDFYATLENEYGFHVTKDHLVVSGICPDCQKAKRN
jgi:Fur family ferric uptake transcriptional regulator